MALLDTFLSNRTWNKHSEKIAWGFALACLLLVLSWIGWTSWSLTKTKNTHYQTQTIRPIKKSNKPSYRVNDIVKANLFGDATPRPVAKKAPETTLNLTLQGILWASDNSSGRAIIQSGKNKTGLYSIGEKIQGSGASIKEIRNNEVILDRNGAVESLPLNRKKSRGNRQIISYDDPVSIDFGVPELAINPTKERNINRTPSASRASKLGSQRIQKPNFSGLNRALRKMDKL